MSYWLFKSEPDEYSIDDLHQEPADFGVWNGIRNYQARNLLRDEVKKGDLVFFYHSSCKNVGIAGIAKVINAAYADPSQFDASSPYYDVKSTAANPRWFCVDLEFVEKFEQVLPLKVLKLQPELKDMVLLRQGRLSIQPVSNSEWATILKLSK